ncbi:MAG: hypothetical protein R6X17_05280 [Candidatus Competibacteraceae bacterium]
MMRKAALARTGTSSPGFHAVRTPDPTEEEPRVGLEISTEKLYQLLMCGAVSVTDFRCLDRASKHHVRTLCLHACVQRLHETAARTPRQRYPEYPSPEYPS